ncbi:MAG: sigma-70 family RNA polymerase sigma factor [Clostridia bacterium]|nr:sigma-70 family RNA polymerase sigma factor [Clostridia bacterium]
MSIEYLVEKYNKLVYRICYDMLGSSLDAQDITQEVYLSLYLNFERYKDLVENDIKNIICKIALNKCKDVLKSKARKLQNLTNDDLICLENYEADNNIEEEIYLKDRSKYLSKIVNELKEPYNDILRKYYLEELSLDEIADLRNTSKATIKMQIHRGKSILKEKLKESGGGTYYDE